ncbi:MAG: hypothetical protein SCARUB_02927 [Candidatus Scalindua rubra]|uniref:Uncharacterized protein n=1 Tax=Candidatus Scalindua rubra TaxID=1872076 RepID=A0A1E3XAF7_9BACT|nr:MAG: hypothetical protein SCARUB_02927 [Candidatus Scalindua rubra]
MNEIVAAINQLYSNFLMRDMTYIFVGAIPLGFLLWAHQKTPWIKESPKVFVAAFLASSYFLGMTLFHAGMLIGVVEIHYVVEGNKSKLSYEDKEVNVFLERDEIIDRIKKGTLKQLQRTTYLKQVHGSLAVALLSLAVLLPIYWYWKAEVVKCGRLKFIVIECVIIALFFSSLFTNRSKSEIQARTWHEVYQRLKGDNNVEKGATIPNLQPVSQDPSQQDTGSQSGNSNQTSGEGSISSSEVQNKRFLIFIE